MKVSYGIGDNSAKHLKFIKQVGVNCVEISLDHVPRYDKNGYLGLDRMLKYKKHIEYNGLEIPNVQLDSRNLRNTLWNRPGRDKEIENVCRSIRVFGKANIPVMYFDPWMTDRKMKTLV